MKIKMASLLEGARESEGTVVIIDVFRAFTTAAVAISRGADKIILVSEVNVALNLRDLGVGNLCMGEVDGIRPYGFDFGNSPSELSQANVDGKILIQSTRAGTVGVNAVHKAERIYAASLVNAQATVKAIFHHSPDLVTIVAMGVEGQVRSDEDEQCALYIRNLLQGRAPDFNSVRNLIMNSAEAQKYDDPLRPQFDPQDRAIALQIDTISIALKVSSEDGLLVARSEGF